MTPTTTTSAEERDGIRSSLSQLAVFVVHDFASPVLLTPAPLAPSPTTGAHGSMNCPTPLQPKKPNRSTDPTQQTRTIPITTAAATAKGGRARRGSRAGRKDEGEQGEGAGGLTPARQAVMAALAPALEEASAPAVLARLDGEIRGVIEEWRGEAESLVSSMAGGVGGGMGGVEDEEGGVGGKEEGGEGVGIVPEGEAAARLTREFGASRVLLWHTLYGCVYGVYVEAGFAPIICLTD